MIRTKPRRQSQASRLRGPVEHVEFKRFIVKYRIALPEYVLFEDGQSPCLVFLWFGADKCAGVQYCGAAAFLRVAYRLVSQHGDALLARFTRQLLAGAIVVRR